MNTECIDIRTAARQLKESGIDTSDRKLRKFLLELGAIRKTEHGYEVTGDFRKKGQLITKIRNHTIKTHGGDQFPREYTVVVITANGMNWITDMLSSPTSGDIPPCRKAQQQPEKPARMERLPLLRQASPAQQFVLLG